MIDQIVYETRRKQIKHLKKKLHLKTEFFVSYVRTYVLIIIKKKKSNPARISTINFLDTLYICVYFDECEREGMCVRER